MKFLDLGNEKYHLGHLVLDSLRSRPDEICQIDAATGESETNASVLRRSIQLARCLRRFGIQPGDVLALGGKNHLDLHIPYYAAILIGMPIAGVDPLFKYLEIKAHFKISSPRIAFCQKEDLDYYLQAVEELELNTKVICFGDGEYSMKCFIEQYNEINDVEEFVPSDFDLDKIYAWLASTGGTTGVLKLAAFKHRKIIDKFLKFQALFEKMGTKRKLQDTPNTLVLHLSPVQWISAYFNTVCFPLMRHTKVSTSSATTTEHVIDIINKYKPDSGMLAPALLTAMMKSDKKCDFTCFNEIMMAGSKIHSDIFFGLKERMRPNAKVTEVYGQTENLGALLVPNPDGPMGNCGINPPGWEILKLVDPETGKEVTDPNTPGELWTKGASLSEYYNNPEETANTHTSDGWYKTGDILYKDENGNYFFVERLKLLIKCRGYMVIAPELESVIRNLPGVADVSVTSIPHEEDGDRPVACVVKRNGVKVTAQQIKDIVIDKLSDSQQLRGGVVFMDQLPMTSTGKVARGKLRQMVLTADRE